MKIRRVVPFTITILALIPSGCKKKPPTPPPVTEAPAPPPAPEKPPEVPEPVQRMVANFQRVFFEFDSAELTPGSKGALDANVKIMQENPDLKIEIQGHADERGTTDYNLALGQRRADAIARYMTAMGVDASRIKVVSYGEERPLDPGHHETAWSKNRRGEFRITWGGDDYVRGTTQ